MSTALVCANDWAFASETEDAREWLAGRLPIAFDPRIDAANLHEQDLARRRGGLVVPGGIRGVTVGPIENSQQPNRGYGSQASEYLLDALVRLGVNWISITPFGRIWSLSSSEVTLQFEAPYEQNREDIARFVAQAHARGLKVLLIPHLWVWTEVGWRGEIDPGSPEGWTRYHRSYREFVLEWARNAQRAGVDAFSIGVECKSWSGRFPQVWSGLIADVRAAFDGWLTYSANWDEAEHVLFWEQIDAIGINAFYPLTQTRAADFQTYRAGARTNLAKVDALSKTLSMPVVFVEVGYTTRRDAAFDPWTWPEDLPASAEGASYDEYEQARALEASLAESVVNPWFRGFFLWRYYAHLDDVSQEIPRGFSPHGKVSEALLHEVFRDAFASDVFAERGCTSIPCASALFRNTILPLRSNRSDTGETAP